MLSNSAPRGRGRVWAGVGGAVLLIGIVSILVASLTTGTLPVSPSGMPAHSPTSSALASPHPAGDFVDESATARGWEPEPITTDPETYIRSALAAASTFDTALSTRDEWLAYLDSWFTPDVRYASEADRQAVLADSRLELRQGVVLPVEEWDSLARSNGRIVATVGSEIAFIDVPDDLLGDMSIGTGDVTLMFTQVDDSGVEAEFDDEVRVSVQVLCGEGSVPTPGSSQRAGDCKVIRYFTEPLEP